MDLKNLTKATEFIEGLKKLDKEIIEIEKQAILLANAKYEVKLSFEYKSLEPKKEKVEFDEDGSISVEIQRLNLTMSDIMMGHYRSSFGSCSSEEKKPSYTVNLSEMGALHIFEFILTAKNKQRFKIMKELNKLGIQIEP